jgi:hypothetical protein
MGRTYLAFPHSNVIHELEGDRYVRPISLPSSSVREASQKYPDFGKNLQKNLWSFQNWELSFDPMIALEALRDGEGILVQFETWNPRHHTIMRFDPIAGKYAPGTWRTNLRIAGRSSPESILFWDDTGPVKERSLELLEHRLAY